VAPVVPRRPPAPDETGDLPRLPQLPQTLTDPRSLRGPAARPALPARGMVVRRRWRTLRSGAGWSWTGASFLLVCWGIWVVSVRGTGLAVPVIGLVLVFAIAALLFVLARLLGRAVLERTLGRQRTSAWPSHLTVAVFLTATGITFLQQTLWLRDSGRWLGDTWRELAALWPL
jgi:hypothetical protein